MQKQRTGTTRILSMLLTIAMVLAAIPALSMGMSITAMAEEDSDVIEWNLTEKGPLQIPSGDADYLITGTYNAAEDNNQANVQAIIYAPRSFEGTITLKDVTIDVSEHQSVLYGIYISANRPANNAPVPTQSQLILEGANRITGIDREDYEGLPMAVSLTNAKLIGKEGSKLIVNAPVGIGLNLSWNCEFDADVESHAVMDRAIWITSDTGVPVPQIAGGQIKATNDSEKSTKAAIELGLNSPDDVQVDADIEAEGFSGISVRGPGGSGSRENWVTFSGEVSATGLGKPYPGGAHNHGVGLESYYNANLRVVGDVTAKGPTGVLLRGANIDIAENANLHAEAIDIGVHNNQYIGNGIDATENSLGFTSESDNYNINIDGNVIVKGSNRYTFSDGNYNGVGVYLASTDLVVGETGRLEATGGERGIAVLAADGRWESDYQPSALTNEGTAIAIISEYMQNREYVPCMRLVRNPDEENNRYTKLVPILGFAYDEEAPKTITITTQPYAETTVIEGAITEALAVAATVSDSSTATYQWYSNTTAANVGGTKLDGETSSLFNLPTDLTEGVYFYFCEISATDAASVRSNVAKVIVEPEVPAVTPTNEPSIVSDNPIQLDMNGVKKAYVSISLGMSSATATDVKADKVDITVDGDAVTVDPATMDADGVVTVKAAKAGDATIAITFDGVDEKYNKTITATVVSSDTPPIPNTYTITVSAGSGGSISPSGNVSVNEGEDKTFNISANNNYRINSVTVDGENKGAISSYTFTGVTENHSISASFTYTGSSSSSGGSSGGSGGGGSSRGDTGATRFAANTPVDVTTTAATSAAKTAAAAAKASGASTATVRIKNPGNISLAALQAMAKEAGMPVKFQADSMNGSAVDVRITLDPAKATKGLNLSASTVNSTAKSRMDFFKKWYSNNIAVVSLGQQGSFGQPVEIAIKADRKMDVKALVFYSYDKTTNSYKRIENPGAWVDQNGYLHFTTELAGDIIISDGQLVRK